MNRCRRVGIDVTRKCNWRCRTCFYRWRSDFNAPYDKPLQDVMQEARSAQARGCDHVVLVGWGEPGLWPHILDMIKEVRAMGMTCSIITNGSLAVGHYAKMREAGLDHLHISVHGTGKTLDEISGTDGASVHQQQLFSYLKAENWPWRMNMTVQKININELPDIALMCLHYGCRHIVSLGFLPHYEWNDPNRLQEVAVHPAEIGRVLEKVHSAIDNHNSYNHHGFRAMFTIRYQPMCHLNPELWKYVVNARYVLYDPWEWDYGAAGLSDDAHWQSACSLGEGVAIKEEPCKSCYLHMHCGGWNRTYAAGFNGADLFQPPLFNEVGQNPGDLHDMNPANHGKGYFG